MIYWKQKSEIKILLIRSMTSFKFENMDWILETKIGDWKHTLFVNKKQFVFRKPISDIGFRLYATNIHLFPNLSYVSNLQIMFPI